MRVCSIGRGPLYVSELALGSPLLFLSGEGDVVCSFTEDVGIVEDSRYGRKEEVESYTKGLKAILTSNNGKVDEDTYKILQGASSLVTETGVTGSLVVNAQAGQKFRVEGVNVVVSSVLDAALASVPYELDGGFGIISFPSTTGFTAPFTISYTTGSRSFQSLYKEEQKYYKIIIPVQDVVTKKKTLVEFYKGMVQLSNFSAVSKEFSKKDVKITLLADYSKVATPNLGHFGRINYID